MRIATDTRSLTELKLIKINEVKQTAKRRIERDAPDWKIMRHKDQIELGLSTDITHDEYINYLSKRQLIRSASDQIEKEIDSFNESGYIINFNIENSSKWQ